MPYLTPDSVPEDGVCRPLFIPNSSDWLAIVSGAITELVKTWNWEQFGAVTVEEAVAAMQDMVDQYYAGGSCMSCAEIIACIYPEGMLTQYDEFGNLEESADGGATWTPALYRDPRFIGERVTLSTGIDCDDAKAMVGYIESAIGSLKDQLDVSAAIGGLVVVILGALAAVLSGGAATALGIAFAGAVASSSSALITAALTAEVMQRLLCNLYMNLNGKTTISTADYDAIRAQLAVDETGLAYTVLWHSITNMGARGLQNSIPLGYTSSVEAYDCEDCDAWCYTFDFEADDNGWVALTLTAPSATYGTWVAGGWVTTDATSGSNKRRALNIERTFASAVITDVEVNYTFVEGAIPTQAPTKFVVALGGTNIIQVVHPASVPASPFIWSGSATVTSIRVSLTPSQRADGGALSGSASVTQVTLRGTGANPFGSDNC